jgi:uncharacterized membrane protein YfcA
MTWQFVLTGLLIGALVGMTGMGGGSLMTPILIIFFGFKPTLAVGTDLLHGAIFKSFGAVRHRQLGTVNARLAAWMFLGSGPTSLLGVSLSAYLERHYGDGVSSAEGKAVGVALIIGGLGFLAKTFLKPKPIDANWQLDRRDKVIAVCIGASCGFIVGLTSVGSGTFFGLLMLLIFPMTAANIVGTDIFHAAALLWVAGFGHLIAGNVDMHAIGWLLIGSIPGVLLGSHLAVRLPERGLRVGFATVLTMSGLKLLDVPYSKWVIPFGLGAGFIALCTLAVRELSARQAAATLPVPEQAIVK